MKLLVSHSSHTYSGLSFKILSYSRSDADVLLDEDLCSTKAIHFSRNLTETATRHFIQSVLFPRVQCSDKMKTGKNRLGWELYVGTEEKKVVEINSIIYSSQEEQFDQNNKEGASKRKYLPYILTTSTAATPILSVRSRLFTPQLSYSNIYDII